MITHIPISSSQFSSVSESWIVGVSIVGGDEAVDLRIAEAEAATAAAAAASCSISSYK